MPNSNCLSCRHLTGEPLTESSNDLLQGTVDLLILKAVSLAPMHGWGISQRIQQVTRGVLEVNQGALYPALHRLEDRGLLDAEWGTSENNRRAKFYTLTSAGRKQLTSEVRTWRRYAGAVQLLLSAV
jgi:transcriptional regulator